MGRRARILVIAALSAAGALGGCVNAPTSQADEPLKPLPFDKHASSGPDAPRLEGASGILRYEAGCLHLQAGAIRTGLVMPDNYSFDGIVLKNPRRTMRIGENLSVSGGFLSDGKEQYACGGITPSLLMVDDTVAPAR